MILLQHPLLILGNDAKGQAVKKNTQMRHHQNEENLLCYQRIQSIE
jgi:hypothetical protein